MSEAKTWDEAAKKMAKEFNTHRSCAACEYYQAGVADRTETTSGLSWGECRLRCPAVTYLKRSSVRDARVFPQVREDYWCGDYVPRRES